MTGSREPDSGEEWDDSVLAELAEQITRKIQAGEEVDLEEYGHRYPRWAGTIRRLFPMLLRLTSLDRPAQVTPAGIRPRSD